MDAAAWLTEFARREAAWRPGAVMDATAWLTEFARREAAWRAERQAFWDGLSARVPIELSHVVVPVVLTPGEEVDVGSDRVPSSARRLVAAAIAAGWSIRVVASVAAVPTSGLVKVVTVRAKRHDERLWAAWRNGAFDVAWYVGPTGLEQAGAERLSTSSKRGTALNEMTMSQLEHVASEQRIKIPTKLNKAAALAFALAAGLTPAPPPPPMRGVLDIVEGIRGPKQWVDVLERQELERAVGLISAAFPELSLTRQ